MVQFIDLEKGDKLYAINLDKSKQSISFEDTDRFIIISDKKVLKYFINPLQLFSLQDEAQLQTVCLLPF